MKDFLWLNEERIVNYDELRSLLCGCRERGELQAICQRLVEYLRRGTLKKCLLTWQEEAGSRTIDEKFSGSMAKLLETDINNKDFLRRLAFPMGNVDTEWEALFQSVELQREQNIELPRVGNLYRVTSLQEWTDVCRDLRGRCTRAIVDVELAYVEELPYILRLDAVSDVCFKGVGQQWPNVEIAERRPFVDLRERGITFYHVNLTIPAHACNRVGGWEELRNDTNINLIADN